MATSFGMSTVVDDVGEIIRPLGNDARMAAGMIAHAPEAIHRQFF